VTDHDESVEMILGALSSLLRCGVMGTMEMEMLASLWSSRDWWAAICGPWRWPDGSRACEREDLEGLLDNAEIVVVLSRQRNNNKRYELRS
jgi:hypothetical protein